MLKEKGLREENIIDSKSVQYAIVLKFIHIEEVNIIMVWKWEY